MATWPGSPGGTTSPYWGPNIRLFVWVALDAGHPWTLGPHPNDRFDSGNVLSRAANPTPPAASTVDRGPSTVAASPVGRLWHDVTCDVAELEVRNGATKTDGAFARAEAGTTTITLADPDRIYDPLSPSSPWQYQGESRLVPGVPVVVFAEVLTSPGTVAAYRLFTGTADSWHEPWTPTPNKRRCTLVASDAVKDLVALDRGEQPPVGAGDTVDARIARILTYYGWLGARNLDASTITLQATSLAQSAWELINRATDDEIGYVHLDPTGVLRFHNRATWSSASAPVLVVGCDPSTPDAWDIAVSADAGPLNLQIRNAVYATRVGGTQQSATSPSSIARYGERGYKRTDLGLADDPAAAAWAATVVALGAWPVGQLAAITLRPAIDSASWATVLDIELLVDRVHVLWNPPDSTDVYDTTPRVLGYLHHINRQRWELTWQLTQGELRTRIWTLGPHAQDRFDDGNVLGLVATYFRLTEGGDTRITEAGDSRVWIG